MRFRLIPREEKFFDLFDEFMAILQRAAEKFLDMVLLFDRIHERGEAVRLCRTMKKIEDIQGHLKEIGRLENEADRIYRETETALFAHPPELLELIKWRELHSWLEETVDACKDVAMIISEIVIKGS